MISGGGVCRKWVWELFLSERQHFLISTVTPASIFLSNGVAVQFFKFKPVFHISQDVFIYSFYIPTNDKQNGKSIIYTTLNYRTLFWQINCDQYYTCFSLKQSSPFKFSGEMLSFVVRETRLTHCISLYLLFLNFHCQLVISLTYLD